MLATKGTGAGTIRGMFSGLAPRYDLVNTIISLGQDRVWRRRVVSLARPRHDGLALDAATGTGELALLLAGRSGRVVAIDLCPEMIWWARAKRNGSQVQQQISFLIGDTLALPFADNTFDCATIGFAMRHMDSIPQSFAELRRVTKPDGRIVCLELTRPMSRVVRTLYRPYLQALVPFIGYWMNGRNQDYAYLHQSLAGFPTAGELKEIMSGVGLRQVRYVLLCLGTVAIHTGLK